MTLSYKNLANKLIWILTVTLFIVFVLFSTYTWGRYFYLGISVLVVILSMVSNDGTIYLKMQPFHIFIGAFALYSLFSSLWAFAASDSISMSTTLFLILICSSMLYMHYVRLNDVASLLNAIKWAGYFVAIYTIGFYGLDIILEALSSNRLSNSFSNVNVIAMFIAFACTIQVSQLLHKRSKLAALFMIPCIIVISATQSKKALIALILGAIGVYLVNKLNKKNALKSIRVILTVSAIGIVIFYSISTISAFSGIYERMQSLFNSFSGEGNVDASTEQRNEMIAVGWEWFLKYPLGGVGIGCPHILNAQYVGHDTYLHNNFVELLCGVGIIGFIIFYSRYLYLFYNLLKYRHADREMANICLVLLIISLILDWGMVSYYDKLQSYYFLLQFVNIQCLKRKAKMIKNETV